MFYISYARKILKQDPASVNMAGLIFNIVLISVCLQCVKEWKEYKKKKITSIVRNVNLNHQYVKIRSTTSNIKHFAVTNRELPEESELAIIKCDGFRIFGLVDKVEQEVVRGRGSSSGDGGRYKISKQS
jgi:hypothetical protein